MGKHVDEISTLETIVSGLPSSVSRQALWVLAHEERRLLLERLQLPECARGVSLLEAAEQATSAKQAKSAVAALESHMQACDVCQARLKAVEPLGPMPAHPLPVLAQAAGSLHQRLSRAPRWLQSALYGAIGMMLFALLRVFELLIGGRGRPLGVILVVAGRLLAMGFLIGFGAGLVYALVRRPTRQLGRVGPYAAGVCSVAGGLLVMAGLRALSTGAVNAPSRPDIAIYGLMTVFLGLIVGHQLRHLDS